MADPAAVPLHDWTRVDAGDWHDFHLAWIAEIRKQLNGGVLPARYSAKAEPQGGFGVHDESDEDGGAGGDGAVRPGDRRFEGDLLTLRKSGSGDGADGGIALADAPPRVRLAAELPGPAPRARRIAVRHASGDPARAGSGVSRRAADHEPAGAATLPAWPTPPPRRPIRPRPWPWTTGPG